jgi:hypothetical protein
MQWPATRPGRFIPGEKPVILRVGSWSPEPEKIKSRTLPGFELGIVQAVAYFLSVSSRLNNPEFGCWGFYECFALPFHYKQEAQRFLRDQESDGYYKPRQSFGATNQVVRNEV